MVDELKVLWKKLSFTEEKDKSIIPRSNSMRAAKEIGQNCLVMKVLSHRGISLDALRKNLRMLWKPNKRIQISEIEDEMFLVEFEDRRDKKKVLEMSRGPVKTGSNEAPRSEKCTNRDNGNNTKATPNSPAVNKEVDEKLESTLPNLGISTKENGTKMAVAEAQGSKDNQEKGKVNKSRDETKGILSLLGKESLEESTPQVGLNKGMQWETMTP
nr:hypothetical protein CFP56_57169 [Quercus suber]